MVMAMAFNTRKVVATIVVAADGSGDYTDIQAGIDALPAGGGVVYVKEGTYNITAAINIPFTDVSIVGAGYATLIQTTLGINFVTGVLSRITLSELRFKGTRIPNQYLNLGGFGMTVKNCWFEDCYWAALISADEVIFTDNNINNCISYGIRIDRPTIRADHNIITGNIIYDGDSHGIYLKYADRNIIMNNQIINHTFDGIWVGTDATETLIVGNVIDTVGAEHIDDDGTATEIGHNIFT